MLVSRHERIPTMSISTLYEVSQRWDLVEALPSKNSNLDKDRRQEVQKTWFPTDQGVSECVLANNQQY